jgi:glutamate synthase domain-containing protein 1
MGKLLALASEEYITPVDGLKSLNAMSEEFDSNSVTGILLRDLGGPFKKLKKYPVLSGVFTRDGLRKLDIFMLNLGFMTKYKVSFKLSKDKMPNIPERSIYIIRVYDFPYGWEDISQEDAETQITKIHIKLKKMGKEKNDMTVFSFWPDVILMKEVIAPSEVVEYLDLNRDEFLAKSIMLYVNESNGCDHDLYSYNPSFHMGFASMNNGENYSYNINRDYLSSRKHYCSDSSQAELLTQIIHYSVSVLDLDIKHLKHIISPLKNSELSEHKDSIFLKGLKQSCRNIAVDGARSIVGSLPDKTLFLAQDPKRISAGVVGGEPGIVAFSSEMTGLEKLLPHRNKQNDYQPDHDEIVILNPSKQGIVIHSQSNRV